MNLLFIFSINYYPNFNKYVFNKYVFNKISTVN